MSKENDVQVRPIGVLAFRSHVLDRTSPTSCVVHQGYNGGRQVGTVDDQGDNGAHRLDTYSYNNHTPVIRLLGSLWAKRPLAQARLRAEGGENFSVMTHDSVPGSVLIGQNREFDKKGNSEEEDQDSLVKGLGDTVAAIVRNNRRELERVQANAEIINITDKVEDSQSLTLEDLVAWLNLHAGNSRHNTNKALQALNFILATALGLIFAAL
ncbi:hypothetical protein DFH09DRAFT_1076302 [Mycena vulgaris]|nr:hypothetical protein DFH09DRAFT_1076302 [Mycena vulgaris]